MYIIAHEVVGINMNAILFLHPLKNDAPIPLVLKFTYNKDGASIHVTKPATYDPISKTIEWR